MNLPERRIRHRSKDGLGLTANGPGDLVLRSAREDWAPDFCASNVAPAVGGCFLVLAGRGVFSDGAQEWPLTRRSFAWWSPGWGRAFWCRVGDPLRVHIFDCQGAGWQAAFVHRLGAAVGVTMLDQTASVLATCAQIHELARRASAENALQAGHLLHATLIGMAAERGDSAALRCWQAARQMVLAEPERAWSVAGLAARLGVSPSYLSRVCRRHGGQPPGRMLRRLRFTACLEDLREGRPLAQLAARLGYADDASFAKAFRRSMGLPTRAWRGD